MRLGNARGVCIGERRGNTDRGWLVIGKARSGFNTVRVRVKMSLPEQQERLHYRFLVAVESGELVFSKPEYES